MPKNEFNRVALMPMIFGIGMVLALGACSPTVKVEAPDKPIEINMNIKIEQEVRAKVEKDLEDMFAEDPELFGIKK